MEMLSFFCIVVLVIGAASSTDYNDNWEIAVNVENKIQLLNTNGEKVGEIQLYNTLKALAYDEHRHTFVSSDSVRQSNTDAIFSVNLRKDKNQINTVQKDLPDDIQGIGIDTLNGVVYWTDASAGTISYKKLSDSSANATVIELENSAPRDVAVDSCARKLYWTNKNFDRSTIESSDLDGSNRKTIIKDNLHTPTGLSLDQRNQRIYWTDKRKGDGFNIESAKIDGSDRKIIHNGTNQIHFSLSVNEDGVFWTDLFYNTLWMLNETEDNEVVVKRFYQFNSTPFGVVTRSKRKSYEICPTLEKEFTSISEHSKRDDAMCTNYCVHGNCTISSSGQPMCSCQNGYKEDRCDRYVCDNYCLNGECAVSQNAEPICNCSLGYDGFRCERFLYEPNSHKDPADSNAIDNFTASELTSPFPKWIVQKDLLNYLYDPIFICLSTIVVSLFVLVIILLAAVCKLKRRPRIKKRIIVNKNITPLTYRPQQTTEQCEITIENCCNMNICETPCFEPPQIRGFSNSKTEEKRTLLTNMEGDDMN